MTYAYNLGVLERFAKEGLLEFRITINRWNKTRGGKRYLIKTASMDDKDSYSISKKDYVYLSALQGN